MPAVPTTGWLLKAVLVFTAASPSTTLSSLQLTSAPLSAIAYLKKNQLPFVRVVTHPATGQVRVMCADLLLAFGIKDTGYQWTTNFPDATVLSAEHCQRMCTISLADFCLYVPFTHARQSELQSPAAAALLLSMQQPSFSRNTFRKNTPAAQTGRAFVQAVLNALVAPSVQLRQVRFERETMIQVEAVVETVVEAVVPTPSAPKGTSKRKLSDIGSMKKKRTKKSAKKNAKKLEEQWEDESVVTSAAEDESVMEDDSQTAIAGEESEDLQQPPQPPSAQQLARSTFVPSPPQSLSSPGVELASEFHLESVAQQADFVDSDTVAEGELFFSQPLSSQAMEEDEWQVHSEPSPFASSDLLLSPPSPTSPMLSTLQFAPSPDPSPLDFLSSIPASSPSPSPSLRQSPSTMMMQTRSFSNGLESLPRSNSRGSSIAAADHFLV